MPWWERESSGQSWDWTVARSDYLFLAEWEQPGGCSDYQRPVCCVSGGEGVGGDEGDS